MLRIGNPHLGSVNPFYMSPLFTFSLFLCYLYFLVTCMLCIDDVNLFPDYTSCWGWFWSQPEYQLYPVLGVRGPRTLVPQLQGLMRTVYGWVHYVSVLPQFVIAPPLRLRPVELVGTDLTLSKKGFSCFFYVFTV